MVIGLLITLDWNIFHIYFLLMLPVILQGHSLQLMDSKLETSKTPTLSSDIHAPCLRHCLLYFKFRRNRDLLDLFFPFRFSFFVPWAFLEAGWVFSVHLWTDLPNSRGEFCYHEDENCSCTSETISSILQPSEQRCRQAEVRQKLHLHLRLILPNISFHMNLLLFCIFIKVV